MRTAIVAGTFLALAAAGGADAADDSTDALRRDVASLLAAMGGADPVDGPSPTALVHRICSAGDERLRPFLQETWMATGPSAAGARWRAPLRRLVSFLFGTSRRDPAASEGETAIFEVDGIVRLRRTPGEATARRDEVPWSFGELVEGGTLRKPRAADVRKAVAALAAGTIPQDERPAVAQAVGEACSSSRRSVLDLLSQFDADPSVPWLVTALGWTGSRAVEPALRGRVASLAANSDTPRAALETACRALRHLDRGALAEEIEKLAGNPRDAAMAAAGLDVAASIDLAAIERASDPAARDAALRDLCRHVRDAAGRSRPSGATTARIVRLFTAGLADADDATRETIAGAAEELLFRGSRAVISRSSPATGDGAGRTSVTGECIGPCPDAASVLASMAADLDGGLFVFADGAPSVFDLAGQPDPARARPLRSAVSSPEPAVPLAPGPEPQTVRLRGEVIGPVIRLTLKNEGAGPISVNPAALHCGMAEFTERAVYGGPGGSRTSTNLKLVLGYVNAFVATPAASLVTVAPGGEFGWGVALRGEHRGATHVSVEMAGSFLVRGRPEARPLTEFAETWVK